MQFSGNKGNEETFARSRESDHTSSPAPPKMSFMKPSEFYSNKSSSAVLKRNQLSSSPSSFGKPIKSSQPFQEEHHVTRSMGNDRHHEDYREEYSHYDSGPVSSEEVYETATSDGLLSLKKVITQKQSSTTRNVVSSSKKIIQKREV